MPASSASYPRRHHQKEGRFVGGTTCPRAQACSLLGHSLRRVGGGLLTAPTTVCFPLYQRLSDRIAYNPPSVPSNLRPPRGAQPLQVPFSAARMSPWLVTISSQAVYRAE